MKNKLIFFDTETTGNTDKDFICQVAYVDGDNKFEALYKPENKIPPEASAVHHITNKMVADKPSFKKSADYKNIKNLFEDENTVAVAHNALFDIGMFKKEDIEIKKFICTLRVARALDPEEKIERYNLQYLRYLLEIEVEAQAHDALGDVMVLEQLFARLKKKIIESENITEDEAINKMIEISSRPSLLRTIRFGKYAGQKLENIVKTDRGYLEWLYGEKIKEESPDEDWIYTLKHYLGK